MLSPKKTANAVSLLGLSCLGVAAALSILRAFVPTVDLQPLISTLGDGFKLCLGALLALLTDRKGSNRRER
jgi:hypothetical protein